MKFRIYLIFFFKLYIYQKLVTNNSIYFLTLYKNKYFCLKKAMNCSNNSYYYYPNLKKKNYKFVYYFASTIFTLFLLIIHNNPYPLYIVPIRQWTFASLLITLCHCFRSVPIINWLFLIVSRTRSNLLLKDSYKDCMVISILFAILFIYLLPALHNQYQHIKHAISNILFIK